jgi:hypothetical protein
MTDLEALKARLEQIAGDPSMSESDRGNHAETASEKFLLAAKAGEAEFLQQWIESEIVDTSADARGSVGNVDRRIHVLQCAFARLKKRGLPKQG